MIKNDNKKNNNKGVGLKAGAVGAITGAAIIAGAAVLSDKKTRKKVMDTVNTFKDKAFDSLNQMQKGVESLMEKAGERLEEGKKEDQEQESKTKKK